MTDQHDYIPEGLNIAVSYNEIDGVGATRTTEVVDYVASAIHSVEQLRRERDQ